MTRAKRGNHFPPLFIGSYWSMETESRWSRRVSVPLHTKRAFGERLAGYVLKQWMERFAPTVQRAVREAGEGRERERVGVVLLDLLMPVMDGAATICVLKRINGRDSSSVVATGVLGQRPVIFDADSGDRMELPTGFAGLRGRGCVYRSTGVISKFE